MSEPAKPPTFTEFAEMIEADAKSAIIKERHVLPHLYICKDGSIQHHQFPEIIVSLMSQNGISPLSLVPRMVQSIQPQMCGVYCEAWMKLISGKTEAEGVEKATKIHDNYRYGDLEKEKQKSEVISITAVDIERDAKLSVFYRIGRTKQGNVAYLTKMFDSRIGEGVFTSETMNIKDSRMPL